MRCSNDCTHLAIRRHESKTRACFISRSLSHAYVLSLHDFHSFLSQGDGQISAKIAYKLFVLSDLSQATLSTIWQIASQSRSALTKDDFFVALRLVALAQRGVECTPENLSRYVELPLPRFRDIAPAATSSPVQQQHQPTTTAQQKPQIVGGLAITTVFNVDLSAPQSAASSALTASNVSLQQDGAAMSSSVTSGLTPQQLLIERQKTLLKQASLKQAGSISSSPVSTAPQSPLSDGSTAQQRLLALQQQALLQKLPSVSAPPAAAGIISSPVFASPSTSASTAANGVTAQQRLAMLQKQSSFPTSSPAATPVLQAAASASTHVVPSRSSSASPLAPPI